jgi:biotin transport system substrate-specific component
MLEQKILNKTILNRTIVYILFIFFSTCLLALSSKIKIPFYPVPMTMQTFVVLSIGIIFGPRLGLITLGIYLLEGMMGIPVFAGTPEKGIGLSYILGPTGGYLIGYMISAFLAGKINFQRSFCSRITMLIFAISPIYIFGIFWLGIIFGFDKPLFNWGLNPFILAEIFKILLLAILMPKLLLFRKIFLIKSKF